MTMIKIEKNVPLPEDGRRKKTIYPFKTMDVGDSFVTNVKHGHQSAATASFRYKPRRFTAREVEGGWRIWRTE